MRVYELMRKLCAAKPDKERWFPARAKIGRPMAKRRNIKLIFGALLVFQQGAYRAVGETDPPRSPMALIALSIQDGASVSELALALGTDIKRASRLVKQLRARGWATVEADASDERLRRVRLTRAGKHLAELLTGGLIDLAFRIVQGDTADVLRQEILVKELSDATRQAHRGAAKTRARSKTRARR